MKTQLTTILKIIVLLLAVLQTTNVLAQTKISGHVTDSHNNSLPGVNVYVKNSYDGTTTDVNGNYSFTAYDTGAVTVLASFISFDVSEQQMHLNGKPVTVNFQLKDNAKELNEVTISAGSIEASDDKKLTVLKPLDIVSTANAEGDITGALKTLPGAQQVNGSTGLFVRGGDATETQTFIDGMRVENPYYSSLPDIASRGRFSPFIFKGTVFSTGGYSAEYGQAMSSAVILDSRDLPDQSSGTLSLTTVGLGGGYEQLWQKQNMSLGGDVFYTNLTPYFDVVKQVYVFPVNPQFFSGDLFFRKKLTKTSILKFYAYGNVSDVAVREPNVDSTNYYNDYGDKNQNIYTNLTYTTLLGKKWQLYLGSSFSANVDDINTDLYTPTGETVSPVAIKQIEDLTQGKAQATYFFGTLSSLKFGSEYQYTYYSATYNSFTQGFNDNFSSVYAEGNFYISPLFVARLGARGEYSSVLDKYDIAPRTSLAYEISNYTQLSVAYGQFYQEPDDSFIVNSYNHALTFERATHYIFNIQHTDDKRTLRIEAYDKEYDHLVTTIPTIGSLGTGYARGVDVFWRDKKTFKNIDYWISYSYIDTKRQYLNYPIAAQPPFAANNTFDIVFKKFIMPINTSVGFTYIFASGFPYYDPNLPPSEFQSERTPVYSDFGFNFAYLTHIKKAFTVFVIGVTNIFGQNNIYTYDFSYSGLNKVAVGPTASRDYFIGLFMSFGTDRSKEVLENN